MSNSFTLQANHGILRSLVTEAGICAAYDPRQPPTPIPQFISFNAVWDTGATGSVINQKVVDQCGLKPVGMTEVHTAGGKCNCEVFLVNVKLPNNVGFPNLLVTKADIGTTEVLIGMDIITKGDFAVTNKDGKTCFTFRIPSTERIDFVKATPFKAAPIQARNDRCACNSGKKYKHCCGASNSK